MNGRTVISTSGVCERDGCFFIAKRLPDSKSSGRWEFPGGKTEKGELPKEALKREYKEEFEIDIEVGDLFFSGEFYNKNKRYIINAFKIKFDPEKLKLTEHSEIEWAPKDKLKDHNFFYSDMLIADYLLKN